MAKNICYFLVDATQPNQLRFSNVFHHLTQENQIHLQMLRDLDWSFQLPINDQTCIHSLYSYTYRGAPHSHGYLRRVIMTTFKASIDMYRSPFDRIAQFEFDRWSIFNQISTYLKSSERGQGRGSHKRIAHLQTTSDADESLRVDLWYDLDVFDVTGPLGNQYQLTCPQIIIQPSD